MNNQIQISKNIENLEQINPEISLWLNQLDKLALFKLRNPEIIIDSINESRKGLTPLSLILTFCPAIKNLESPNSKGQTRSLITLDQSLPRAKVAIEEIIGFLIFTKITLGIQPDLFLVFADSIEKGAENMFNNSEDMANIATQSVKGIQQLFQVFDIEHPGLIQKHGIQIPKIRKQSILNTEANKVGRSRHEIIESREVEMLDPLNPLFEIWRKHLILTREDGNFVATGWQTKKGAGALWNRVRFLLAEFMADGEILPKLVKLMNPKKFKDTTSNPIFIASTTRRAGFEMEVDGFNTEKKVGIIAPLHNIGRWNEDIQSSPWLNFLI